MSYEIRVTITGSGDAQKIAKQLHQVADQIAAGDYANSIAERGQATWEDPEIITTITENDE
jgi:hypothetical protein